MRLYLLTDSAAFGLLEIACCLIPSSMKNYQVYSSVTLKQMCCRAESLRPSAAEHLHIYLKDNFETETN